MPLPAPEKPKTPGPEKPGVFLLSSIHHPADNNNVQSGQGGSQ